ncbi:MAG TPA: hypothetical protein VMT28_16015 [Terriglobales bacterium]|nr:hypothetical protein [Terriglobales bacterium]
MTNTKMLFSRLAKATLVATATALIALVAVSAQAAESSNRLTANSLAANRLAGNSLAANRLASGNLSSNGLDANPATTQILSTPEGRELYSYMISCALPAGKAIEATLPSVADTAPPTTLYTCAYGSCRFPGDLGLAEDWINRPLDTKGQRWVSACLLARINHYGIKQMISLRGVAPQLWVTPQEARDYTVEEGAFYGNVFDESGALDWNACRGKDAAAGETRGLKVRVCAQPDPNNPAQTMCGFKYAGECGSYLDSSPESHACSRFDSDELWYGECLAGPKAGNNSSTKSYSEVITVYVKP